MQLLRLFIFCCCLVSAALGSAAPSYPLFLNGDRNYILVDAHQGTAWYLDRDSVYAELYQPPEYVMQLYVVKVDEMDKGNTAPNRMIHLRLRYNLAQRAMYYDRTDKGTWQQLPPHGTWAQTGVMMPAGEAAFYLFFGEKFYGRWSFPQERDGKIVGHASPFASAFYDRLKDDIIIPVMQNNR